jgi:hypothetical protein
MGPKTNISTAPTLTPEQKVLLDSMMRGVTDQMQGFEFGEGWAGPSFDSYANGAGYGGKPWTDDRSGAAGGASPIGGGITPQAPGRLPMTTRANASAMPPMAVPAAKPIQASNPNNVNPFGMAAYSNREQLVSPIVNPFRRNIGG